MERGLGCSAARVVNAAETNSGGTGVPSGKVVSATMKGLNGFAIGTLMPLGLKAHRSVAEWIRGKPSGRPGSIKK